MTGPRFPQGTLFPAVAFALALGAAAVMTSSASDAPATSLYRAVATYHDALARGDAVAAAGFVPGGGEEALLEQAARAREVSRRAWRVVELALEEAGRLGRVEVAWLASDGSLARTDRESWRRLPEGRWLLLDADDGPVERFRFR